MFLDGHNEARSRAVFVSVTVTFGLASILVAARLVARAIILKQRGWDSYCILLAWVSTLLVEVGRKTELSTWTDASPTRYSPFACHSQSTSGPAKALASLMSTRPLLIIQCCYWLSTWLSFSTTQP